MPTVLQNIKTTAGDEFTIEIAVTDDDGLPAVLTGATITYMMAKSLLEKGRDTVIRKVTGDADVSVAGNVASIEIKQADTFWIEPVKYQQQCRIRLASGRELTAMKGVWTIEPRL